MTASSNSRGKNQPLIDARKRLTSASGDPMTLQEVAEAMNAFLWEQHQKTKGSPKPTTLDHRYVASYEAGRHWWPSQQYRAAWRYALRVETDAELGFTPKRRRRGKPKPSMQTAVSGPTASRPLDRAPANAPTAGVRPSSSAGSESLSKESTFTSRLPNGGAAHLAAQEPGVDHDRTASWFDGGQGPVDIDLVGFASVLDQRRISNTELTAAELACEHLDQGFARTSPDEVLTKIRMLMERVSSHLRQPQSLRHHERLVRLAARLAGLRGWACFDIDDHHEAERWYEAAVAAAHEARAWGLGAWLLGAQSLIPWHRRDLRTAADLIGRGIFFAGQESDATTRAWLFALQARACAAMGNKDGFDTSYGMAEEAAEHSSERDRRHGMDFAQGILDLRYYCGTSRLLLRQPQRAVPELTGSLADLPASHTKARAVLTLFLADATVQSGDAPQAVRLAQHALASTIHQPIVPILQQGRRIRRLVQQRDPVAGETLNEAVHAFSDALTTTAVRAKS